MRRIGFGNHFAAQPARARQPCVAPARVGQCGGHRYDNHPAGSKTITAGVYRTRRQFSAARRSAGRDRGGARGDFPWHHGIHQHRGQAEHRGSCSRGGSTPAVPALRAQRSRMGQGHIVESEGRRLPRNLRDRGPRLLQPARARRHQPLPDEGVGRRSAPSGEPLLGRCGLDETTHGPAADPQGYRVSGGRAPCGRAWRRCRLRL